MVLIVVPHVVYTEAAVDAMLADKLRAETHVYLQRVANSLRDQGLAVQTRILAHAQPSAFARECSSVKT